MARTADQLRKAELAQIHIAKAQLGLDEDTYRAMLWTVGRVKSSADLDWAGRKRVLDHLKAKGFTTARQADAWSFIDRAPADKKPALRVIVAICRKEGWSKAYAEGVARRQHGVDRRLEMMDARELSNVASALKRTQAHQQGK